ncbi:MAG TPA: PHP domain-containing protein, partial [Thiotrichaceae bacterium]|nr:PHP domain-containing protein [Thiotrichaceae bacterium]
MSFVHLRLHSEYSLNQSTIRIKALNQAIIDGGMSAVALTDLNNVYALVKFFRASTGVGIKPIFGVDCLLRNEQGGHPFHFNMLCKTDTGYLNMCRLISKAFLEGQSSGTPMLDKAWLAPLSEGLIILSGAKSGDVGQALMNDKPELAASLATEWASIFPDSFYLELQRTGRPHDEENLHQTIALATQLDLPVVATNDVQFLQTEDFYSHEARVCISEGYILDDPKRPKNFSNQQYLRSAEEMEALFADIPEAIENTVEIAKRCNVTLKLGENYLPSVPMPEGMTDETYFIEESKKGLEERLDFLLDRDTDNFNELRKPYDERLQVELDVILGMGFPSYFLIVADFIQWAKDNDIPVGPGRGSGAGSLVAYALKITDLDPLEYDLLFE